jgi:UDP-N-acetylglucosamine:LPS N-acetylglucosamine transferase
VQRLDTDSTAREEPRRILVVSASMGAGHDGAARELRARLAARGDDARVVDFLELASLRLGAFMRWTYEVQLRLLPWTYELLYRMASVLPVRAPLARFAALVSRRTLARELELVEPDVVVSTYPLASLALGHLRERGWLRVPAITYVTDFGVHPLWTHPGIDLTLAVSASSAMTARERTRRPVESPGPLVAAPFREELPDRADVRARLGLGADERAVLVVAGSWGVGDVLRTVEVLTRSGRFHPVAVCGRDDRLRARLERSVRAGRATVLGWTDEMPALMAACDALVENAGGLTCMEAYATQLPVVSYRPIAGHGRENAACMAEHGAARHARTDAELVAALDELTTPGSARSRQVARAGALFAGDPARTVHAVAVGGLTVARDGRADARRAELV